MTAVALSACSFDPSVQFPQAAVGEVCRADADCGSAVCGTGGVCQECRTVDACGSGRTCAIDTGRCVDVVVPPTGPRVHVPTAGLSGTNGTRRHVGRVAVVPVSSSSEVRR